MKIKLGSGLLAIDILAAILVLTINFIPGNFIRIILGLPFVLFFPGYSSVIALFPRKESLGGIQLLTLSFGLSIAIVPLIGFLLNFCPWGIRLEPIIYSLFGFLIIVSVIAWLRLQRLPGDARRSFNFTLSLPNLGRSRLARGIYIVSIIAVLVALGTVGYVITRPKVGDKYTEFYVLGINGQAASYPTNFTLTNGQVTSVEYGTLSTGLIQQWGHVTVGIVNHEGQDTTYTVAMQIDGTQVSIPFEGGSVAGIGPITLKPEEKWEQELGIVPQHTGNNQKVEIFLYKDAGAEPYLNLHLWINVN